MILDHVEDGGSFAFLAKLMDWYNSIGKEQISSLKKTDEIIYAKVRAGKKVYSLFMPIAGKLDWIGVLALYQGETINVTDEFREAAGPLLNFWGLTTKPKHINTLYEKVAFVWNENDIIEVGRDEIILQKLKERLIKLKNAEDSKREQSRD